MSVVVYCNFEPQNGAASAQLKSQTIFVVCYQWVTWMRNPLVGSLLLFRLLVTCVLWHPAFVPARSWTPRHSASAPGWSGSAYVLVQASCFQYSWVPPSPYPPAAFYFEMSPFATLALIRQMECMRATPCALSIVIQVSFCWLFDCS